MKPIDRRSFMQKMTGGLAASLIVTDVAYHSWISEKKLNIALCGLGRYAQLLAEGLEQAKNCQLAGIITGTPAKAAQWKAKYNIPSRNIYDYKNFDQIAHNPAIDVVYVVLPNGMHHEYTLRAIAAGKHVIVEKPMAISSKQCEEMINAAKKAGVQLALGYRLHYEPAHLELMRLGQQKVFGPVRMIEASLGYKTGAGEWRLHKPLSGGGPLMNVGVYCIQCNRYILGEEPVSVTAQWGPVTDPVLFKEVEASISWQLIFPSGAVGNSSTTYNCFIDRLYVGADDGFIDLNPGLGYGPFKGSTSKGDFSFPAINQQAAQLDGIASCILQNKPLPAHITGEEGIKDVRIIEKIYEAASTGRKIDLI